MIDFKEEVSKYKPVLSVDDVASVVNDEIRDIMDLLQHVTKQQKEAKE
ncbi:MAG: hypothetical protein FWD03_09645 [Defluviitaleaceae bacterium]|nr:hypothetical protein [Defluviitaleaceae bacterium]